MGNIHVHGAGTVTAVNGKTGDVVIGGRNFARSIISLNYSDTRSIVTIDQGRITVNSDIGWNAYGFIPIPDTYTVGERVTISMDIKITGLSDASGHVIFDCEWWSQSSLIELIGATNITAKSVGWHRYRISGTIPSGATRILFSLNSNTPANQPGANQSGVVAEYRDIAAYAGDGLIDWIPAPEDILYRLEAIEAKLGITYEPPMADGLEMEDMEMDNMTHAGGV